ncbi:MAG: hypothetical protein ACP5H2_01440 [Solirubrobacteraceae bacterium]
MSTTSTNLVSGGRHRYPLGVAQWTVVFVVGVLIVTLILAFNLLGRLEAGQTLLGAAKPAMTTQRLAGDAAGVAFVSADVNMATPIITAQGGAASEVPGLIALIASRTGASQAAVRAELQKNFPHTTGLLEAIPLSSVSAELPGLELFLAHTLKIAPAQLATTLKVQFPALYQAVSTLPVVSSGWQNVPGVSSLTRFDGTPVRTVPQLRDYLQKDLVPALRAQHGNFESFAWSTLNWIPLLLLVIGGVVALFAAVMVVVSFRGISRTAALGAAVLVPIVGVVAIGLEIGLKLNSRVDHGQTMLTALQPVFQKDRVTADRAGINMVDAIIRMQQPIINSAGGASAEVPKLVALVSQKSGLSQPAVRGLLKKDFPHTTALLQALPLRSVSAELPSLEAFLAVNLKLSPAHLLGVLKTSFPALYQTIVNAPTVTGGWDSIPGTAKLTNFAGAPVRSAPAFAAYMSGDVVPLLESQRANFQELAGQGNISWIGVALFAIGIVATEFGLVMVWTATYVKPRTYTVV